MGAASNLATAPSPLDLDEQPPGSPRTGILVLAAIACAALIVGIGIAEGLVRLSGLAATSMTEPIYQRSTAPGVVYEFRSGAHGYTWGHTWVDVNALGLRGPEVDRMKPPGMLRIGVFGDSATFGQGVRDEDTYARVMEHRTKDRQVLNFGVPSYNIANIVSTFIEKGLPLHLDVAVIAPIVEDYGFHRAHTVDDYGYPVHVASPVKPGIVKNVLRRLHLSYLVRDAWWSLEGAGTAEIQVLDGEHQTDPLAAATWERAEHELSRFVAAAREHGIESIYLAMGRPMPDQLNRIVTRAGFNAIVDMKAITATHPPLALQVSTRDAHPSPLYHRLMAQALEPLLRATADAGPR